MSYSVHEIYLTVQGEGRNTGRLAVFCRFTGCNLWSGRESDRAHAICRFCDTEFLGTSGPAGGRFANIDELVAAIDAQWPAMAAEEPFVVFTGGEPLLQLDEALVKATKRAGFRIAIETNGTLEAPGGIDWICVSPKATASLRQSSGNELKLVYPQPGAEPECYENLSFDHFLLQPMDGPSLAVNTAAARAYCAANPRWELSLQTHKLMGLR